MKIYKPVAKEAKPQLKQPNLQKSVHSKWLVWWPRICYKYRNKDQKPNSLSTN
uniref:Uncharacterized protein n=1 Tax=Rhizophora mucronata TaxID=61149 RepID=A0A2P2PEH0_RHIMU